MGTIRLITTCVCLLYVLSATGQEDTARKAKLLIDSLFFSEKPIELDRASYDLCFLTNEKGERLTHIRTDIAIGEHSRRYAIPKEEVPDADEWLSIAKAATEFLPVSIGNAPLLLQPGDAIGPFSLTDWNGQTWTSQSTLGKPLVLNFWYTGCKPCIREMSEISKWIDSCPNVNYLAVTWDTADQIRPIVNRTGFRFVQVPNDTSLFQKLGGSQTPLTVVIDKRGVIRMTMEGTSLQKRDLLLECIREVEQEQDIISTN